MLGCALVSSFHPGGGGASCLVYINMRMRMRMKMRMEMEMERKRKHEFLQWPWHKLTLSSTMEKPGAVKAENSVWQVIDHAHVEKCSSIKASCPDAQQRAFALPWKQLRKFPADELSGKVVLVRCDLSTWLKDGFLLNESAATIIHLHRAGSRIVLASHWDLLKSPSEGFDCYFIAGCLSHQIKQEVKVADGLFDDHTKRKMQDLRDGEILLLGNLCLQKEEAANDKQFSKLLSEQIDIFVSDAFSVSHRVLASNVGVTRFTSFRLAGFQLEKELYFLTLVMEKIKHPTVAIIGGMKFSKLYKVIYSLLRRCDTIFITGSMMYTFFHALGYRCSDELVEKDYVSQALHLLKLAEKQRINICLPCDIICIQGQRTCNVLSTDPIPKGWVPLCPGEQSLDNICVALRASQLALWVGPISMISSLGVPRTAISIAECFGDITKKGCVTIIGGKEPKMAAEIACVTDKVSHISQGGVALLRMLEGAPLPGVAALDLECPKVPKWMEVYGDAQLPLLVDLGSGNGLFNLQMAEKYEGLCNFLGIESNKKLVDRCLATVTKCKLSNVHFIWADAATALQTIISDYPGQIHLIAIQCPDPNFTDPENRRRMVQKPLVEAIVANLCEGGEVFLQSDVKEVMERMKAEFFRHGRGCFTISKEEQSCDEEGWLKNNPFGVSSDWERHAIARGDRMYRVMLSRRHQDAKYVVQT